MRGRRRSWSIFLLRLVAPGVSSSDRDYMLSLWRPSEGVRSVLVEGRLVKMWNLKTSSNKTTSHPPAGGTLQLTASSQSRFEEVNMAEVEEGERRKVLAGYRPRECVSIGRLVRGEGVWWEEFDTVGLVVRVISECLEPDEDNE